MRGAPGGRGGRLVAAAAVLGLATACGGQEAELVSTPITSPPAPVEEAEEAVALRVDLDEVTGPLHDGAPVLDSSGHHLSGTVRLGGRVPAPLEPLVTEGGGAALRMSPPCEADDDSCPRGVLEFAGTDLLNPGTRDFRWGARVLLAADETDEGSNIMQKGFNEGGRSQWKLQVDGDKGRPSCVLVGENGEEALVTAAEGIADGAWHEVECVRSGGVLAVLVDGVESRSKPVPPAMSVRPPSAVRVGGKSIKPGNDQFHGVVDDIFVAVTID